MRKLMFSLLILAVFLGFALLWQEHVDGYVKTLEEKSIALLEKLEQGGDEEALSMFAELEQLWHRSSDHWAMMMDHKDLKEIEEHLKLSRAHCQMGELHDSYGELALFLNNLLRIPCLYRMEWRNIL